MKTRKEIEKEIDELKEKELDAEYMGDRQAIIYFSDKIKSLEEVLNG